MAPPNEEAFAAQQAVDGVSDRLLPLLMAAGLVGGFVLGFAIRATDHPWTDRQVMYVGFPGELFVRMMSGVTLPLISSSVVAALGSSRLPVIGRVCACSLALSLFCKLLATAEALSLAIVLSPGNTVRLDIQTEQFKQFPRLSTVATDRLLDLVRNLFPSNIIEAHLDVKLFLVRPAEESRTPPPSAASNAGEDFHLTKTFGSNHLGVLSFSILLGLVLAAFRDDQNVVLNVFVSLSNTVMTATHMLLWFAPVGLCSTSMALVLGARDLQTLAGDLSMYVMALVAAMVLHGAVVLPALYLVLTRRHLWPFFRNMVYPISVAFGTASSSATVPTSIVALEEGLHLDPRLARFLAPVGAIANMDGSAIYLVITVLFFAQRSSMGFTVGQYLLIGLMCIVESLNTSPTPESNLAGLVYLMQVLEIPMQDIGVLLFTDWLMNRLASTVNMLGDAVVASATQVLCATSLARSKHVPEAPHATEEPNELPG
ncbi:excitatory amino acid transporter-like [Haemaphysalis longicornis]